MNFSQKTENLAILIYVYIYMFVRGIGVKVPRDIKSVIVPVAKLGDTVCTTPVFRAIKKRYPHTRVFVVGEAINKEVLANNADVDEYIVWHDDAYVMRNIFLQHNFDVGFLTAPSANMLAALYLAGTPCIIAPRIEDGWCPTETMLYKLLRRLVIVVPHIMGQYAPREYLRLLEPIGIYTQDTKKYLNYSDRCPSSM